MTYNAETGRYNVRMPQGEVIALKPTNLAAATEGSTGFGEAGSAEAKAAAEAKEKERKASIGQRMAAKRNAKGIGWAIKSSVSGMFASEGKRQEAAARRASNPIKEDYDEVCVCVTGTCSTHQQAHSPSLPLYPSLLPLRWPSSRRSGSRSYRRRRWSWSGRRMRSGPSDTAYAGDGLRKVSSKHTAAQPRPSPHLPPPLTPLPFPLLCVCSGR